MQFIGYSSDDNHEKSRCLVEMKSEIRCKGVYLCTSLEHSNARTKDYMEK